MYGGNAHACRQLQRRCWSIPACTGETNAGVFKVTAEKVYPRVYGGNTNEAPRFVPAEGLSPRVRGKLKSASFLLVPKGSIPACTGETRKNTGTIHAGKVYPRVYGGNVQSFQRCYLNRGLSPRVRGKRPLVIGFVRKIGSIPACTGETPSPARNAVECRVYPRVYGGNKRTLAAGQTGSGLSPRVRGKL